MKSYLSDIKRPRATTRRALHLNYFDEMVHKYIYINIILLNK